MGVRKKPNNSAGKKKKLLGILLILLAVLLFVSLVSHSGRDDRMFTTSDNPFAVNFRNQVGTVGAISSYYFKFFFGWMALFIPVILVAPALVLLGIKARKKILPAIWMALLVGTLVTLIINIYRLPQLAYSVGSAGAAGGYLFYQLAWLFLKIAGRIGSVIICVAGLAAVLVWLNYTYPVLSRVLGIRVSINRQIVPRVLSRFKTWLVSLIGRPATKRSVEDESAEMESPSRSVPKEKPVRSNGGFRPVDEKGRRQGKPQVKLKSEKKPPVFGRETQDFVFPDLDLLTDDPVGGPVVSNDELKQTADDLRETLKTFNVHIDGPIEKYPGPVITRFEFKPAAGIKVNQIVNLADDLALALKAKRIRIVAPIPGKAAVGVEIPNRVPRIVYLKDILSSENYGDSKVELPLALGKSISGRPFVTDLSRMPHLLVAGATNSGKSVCINAMITSLLYRLHPKEIKLILIDPKMLELSVYAGIPHLGRPVVTNPKRAEKVLSDAVGEMQTRYEKLAKAGVRNITDYNSGRKDPAEKMPYIVIIVDELADMMIAAASTQIEEKLTRLAQMARAVGIHLILATQRPSVDVITGLIKANFPARMAFHVASKTDSRTILDANGAEKLLGNGDMLFLQPGHPEPTRLHGAFITSTETQQIVEFINDQFTAEETSSEDKKSSQPADEFEDVDIGDPLFLEAVKTVIRNKQGSVSLLQRKLGIGYQRAARLIDQLEEAGVVAPYSGSKARDVLVDENFIKKVIAARSLSDSN